MLRFYIGVCKVDVFKKNRWILLSNFARLFLISRKKKILRNLCYLWHSFVPFQNSEFLTLTYGAFVTQMLRDYENVDDVNKQLERIGYNMGMRLIEDFLARTSSSRCLEMRETADRIQQAFRMYLNIQPQISNWSASGDEFSLIFENNPLIEFVELPQDLNNLRYSAILSGCIRGALAMVQLEVQCWFAQDQLKGDNVTEIRVKFIRRLEDAIPAGED